MARSAVRSPDHRNRRPLEAKANARRRRVGRSGVVQPSARVRCAAREGRPRTRRERARFQARAHRAILPKRKRVGLRLGRWRTRSFPVGIEHVDVLAERVEAWLRRDEHRLSVFRVHRWATVGAEGGPVECSATAVAFVWRGQRRSLVPSRAGPIGLAATGCGTRAAQPRPLQRGCRQLDAGSGFYRSIASVVRLPNATQKSRARR